ncbi:MAG: polysaccharide biosynthesis tyrosine autokinase [Ardenticatenia bacterium]|nr:polysaccharide biosynthesis tyrosine autokinase [Ardenticatenia bacterium]
MELRQYTTIIWRWLWLIILGALLAGLTAFVVSRRTVPVYEASATLLIQQADNPSLDSNILDSERLARTYADLLKAPVILDGAAARLGLEGIAAGDVSVQSLSDTRLIRLKVESISPRLAAEIADIIPVVFIERNEALQLSRFSESKESLARELSRLQADIETAQARIEAIGEPASAADQAELGRLQTGLTQHRSSYAMLLSSYEEIRLTEARAMDNVVVFQEAVVSKNPVRPHTMRDTLLAAVVGAMLAVGTAFLIEYLDDTVKSPEDVTRVLGLSTLGAIAHMRLDGRANRIEEQLVTAASPKSPISEAFRTLRTNIKFSSVDKPIRRLLVTSPSPTDGKSITAANLATVMAQAGQSVVLVDADLRRPVLHKIFQLPNNVGLTTSLLTGSNPGPNDCLLSPPEMENLQVLTSGPLPPNPSELLGSQRMGQLIEHLEQQADLLIFDSPPTLAVTDAAVLAKQVDGVLLVIDAGTTREEVARRAIGELSKVGAPVLGVVLNKVPVRRGGGYGYYYYHYYYSDSEGDQKERRRRHRSSRRTPSTLRGAVRRIAETLRLGRGK